MEEVNYKKLRNNYKQMFDMCAFVKTDHKDLNEFKLYFNSKLLNIFLKDQSKSNFRGLSGYAELKASLHEQLEKEFFSKKDNIFSMFNIERAIDEANFVAFDMIQDDESHRYNFINIKLIIPTLELNEPEKTFIAANIGTTFDEGSCSGTLAVATLHRQRKEIDNDKLEKWAKQVVLNHLRLHHYMINKESAIKLTIKERVLFKCLDIYVKHLI